ncbi:POK6 protein, partial [Sula dactylatra]|nr:POK6 protein [Sula dactylatra]
RGLQPRQIWQADVTEIPVFGRLRHAHVTVDTCSKAIWATAAPSTSFKYVKQHWLAAFAVLGRPQITKTDNGPSYKSKACEQFLIDWGITHKTGIPYNSTGQAIIE